jgi:hypothetical protein
VSDIPEIVLAGGGGAGAPTDKTYVLKDATGSAGLTAPVYLSALAATGLLHVVPDGTLTVDTSTYLTTASAAATYLTIATAAATYLTLGAGETAAHAAATYLTIATAASTYQPKLSLVNKNVLYASGATTVAQDSRFTYDDASAFMVVPAIHTNTVTATAGDLALTATAGGAQINIQATTLIQINGASYQLNGLTGNGFVKTSGGAGALSIDTSTYLTTASAASTYQPILSATAGSVLFSGGTSVISQNNNNFYWDNTNTRLILAKGGAYTPSIGAPITILGGTDIQGTAIYFGATSPNTILASVDMVVKAVGTLYLQGAIAAVSIAGVQLKSTDLGMDSSVDGSGVTGHLIARSVMARNFLMMGA